MPDPVDLPGDAVEAAAKAAYEQHRDHADEWPWGMVFKRTQDGWRAYAEVALRAALPHLTGLVRGQALTEAAEAVSEWLADPQHAECFEDHELVKFLRTLAAREGLGTETATTTRWDIPYLCGAIRFVGSGVDVCARIRDHDGPCWSAGLGTAGTENQ